MHPPIRPSVDPEEIAGTEVHDAGPAPGRARPRGVRSLACREVSLEPGRVFQEDRRHVSRKSAKIAGLIEGFMGRESDPHYLGYFDCFHRGLYYEAHDVLEELWLPSRGGPDDRFFKGLIQLAGAFVHLQKNRLRPSAALFKLARANLEHYRPRHRDLDMGTTLELIGCWLDALEKGSFEVNPLLASTLPPPQLAPRPCP